MRQPRPELELGLTLSAIAPNRRNLNDAIAGKKCLDRDLEIQFETLLALESELLQHIAIVDLESVGCVVRRNPAKHVQAHAGHARESLLHNRTVHDAPPFM